MEVEGVVDTADREGNGCLEQVSVTGQYAIEVVAGDYTSLG